MFDFQNFLFVFIWLVDVSIQLLESNYRAVGLNFLLSSFGHYRFMNDNRTFEYERDPSSIWTPPIQVKMEIIKALSHILVPKFPRPQDVQFSLAVTRAWFCREG